MKTKIPATNCIQAYLHCAECIKEKPPGTSPRDYSQIEVGYTPIGYQVWCKRHNLNICHIHFEGMKHPANLGVTDVSGEIPMSLRALSKEVLN